MTDPDIAAVLSALDWLEITGIGDKGHAIVSVVGSDGEWADEHTKNCKPCNARAALARVEAKLEAAEKALKEIIMADVDDPPLDLPWEAGHATPWPSFAGRLQNIAARALAGKDAAA